MNLNKKKFDERQGAKAPRRNSGLPFLGFLASWRSIWFFCFVVFTAGARAENVDLSTVPDRASVQLTIYNSEDLTLVRETRKVTFKKGVNPLQFSWANTLIDPSSVELKFLTNPDKLTVLDTTFPHAKPQMLYWNVQSDFDGEAKIEITYFTSGITWVADYVAIANAAEDAMHIDGFVRVQNNSGEDYENAQVRLVVGTINLVEKIAQLAQIPVDGVENMKFKDRSRFDQMRKAGAKAMVLKAEVAEAMSGPTAAPKEIIKEGLSEYFIFTIEGTESVPNGWSKRMRSMEADKAPFKIQYRYRPRMYGEQLVRLYLLVNNKDSKLGSSPLPDGAVRVLRENGRDGLSFLAQNSIKYIPIGDKMELVLGPDPEVIFELIKLRSFRDNIWLMLDDVRTLRRVDDGALGIDVRSHVAGWTEHQIFTQRIRNYSGKAIDVEVERPWDGHVIFRSELQPKLFDFRTPVFVTKVQPGEKKEHLFEIVRHQGRNAKQNNVTLEEGAVNR